MGSIREASCWQHQYYKKVGWGAGKVEKDKERKYFLKKPKKNPKKTKAKKPNQNPQNNNKKNTPPKEKNAPKNHPQTKTLNQKPTS